MNSATPFSLPKNKIVFTTTDGVGLKKGDEYWYVGVGYGDRLKLYCITIMSGQDFPKGFAQFSTKELAEKSLKYEYNNTRQCE